MVWQIPEELRMEVAGLGSVRPYASTPYMSTEAYRTQATYKAHIIENSGAAEDSLFEAILSWGKMLRGESVAFQSPSPENPFRV